MPSHRRRPKKSRDKAVRSLTSNAMTGATSLANKTIYRPMNISKTERINKGKYAVEGAKYAFENLGKVSKIMGDKAYEYVAPMAEEAYEQGSKMMGEMIRNQMVPRVDNNPSWEDLRRGLTVALRNIGIINHDEEVPTPIYFQSVQKFLDIHKIKINKGDINIKTKTFEGIHPGNTGDATPGIMKRYFENGIKQDSIINALEYVFQDILFPRDVDFEPEPEQEPGEGFRLAKEQTMKKQKEAKILSLKRTIETLMLSPEEERKKYYDSLISQCYKEIERLITTEKEIKLFAELNKEYPELKGSKKKKKTRRRKKKKTNRKKKK